MNTGINDWFVSPMEGTMLDLSNVPDAVFSERYLGDGFAVELSGGNVTSPVDGVVTMVFPTGHAIGITDCSGRQVILHIGIDTVKLNGKGFKIHASEGQVVLQNELLVEVDLEEIKKATSVISPVIFPDGTKPVLLKEKQKIVNGESNIIGIA